MPQPPGFGAESTKYTKEGPGTKGGSSWTPEWLKFDNSYFVVCGSVLVDTYKRGCFVFSSMGVCFVFASVGVLFLKWDFTCTTETCVNCTATCVPTPNCAQEVKEKKDAELLVLPTDDCLFTDPGFKYDPH